MSVEADLSWAKTWLKQEKKHYINGSWVAGAGELWNLKNPATGEILTTIPLADTDQVAAAARAAHHCHQGDIFQPYQRNPFPAKPLPSLQMGSEKMPGYKCQEEKNKTLCQRQPGTIEPFYMGT